MRSTIWLLTTTASALSLIALIVATQHIGLLSTFDLVVAAYTGFVAETVGRLQPLIDAAAAQLSSMIGLKIVVHDHWRHVAVLMSVYFMRDALGAFRARLIGTFVLDVILGLVIALGVSVAVGTQPLSPDNTRAHCLVAGLPVLGVTLYDVISRAWRASYHRAPGQSWIGYFADTMPYVVTQALAGVSILAGGLGQPLVLATPSPGFVLLLAFIVVIALRWLARGIDVVATNRTAELPWFTQYRRTAAARLGFAILGTLSGAALFFLVEAGARYVFAST